SRGLPIVRSGASSRISRLEPHAMASTVRRSAFLAWRISSPVSSWSRRDMALPRVHGAQDASEQGGGGGLLAAGEVAQVGQDRAVRAGGVHPCCLSVCGL